ncbi:MAG: hypothetical protein J0H01_25340 [Rhizobiales bacterium]|nr:hypothetical protein [Hyphomicrobiales bacterium]
MPDASAARTEQFSVVVAAIYDCALAPGKWPEALRLIAAMNGVAASRGCPGQGFDDGDPGMVRLLAPHIRRAFAISGVLERQLLASHLLEATLDALALGVFLVAADGRIVHMNRAAERLIQSGAALRVADHRMAPADAAAAGALAAAVIAAVGHAGEALAARAIALPDGQGGGLVATVLSLVRDEAPDRAGPADAAAVVFVQQPGASRPLPCAALAGLYGLTRAELKVLLALAPGLGLKEAAATLGIGETTAKTHLQHVFEKTGTAKQSELLRLLMSAAAPVGPS